MNKKIIVTRDISMLENAQFPESRVHELFEIGERRRNSDVERADAVARAAGLPVLHIGAKYAVGRIEGMTAREPLASMVRCRLIDAIALSRRWLDPPRQCFVCGAVYREDDIEFNGVTMPGAATCIADYGGYMVGDDGIHDHVLENARPIRPVAVKGLASSASFKLPEIVLESDYELRLGEYRTHYGAVGCYCEYCDAPPGSDCGPCPGRGLS